MRKKALSPWPRNIDLFLFLTALALALEIFLVRWNVGLVIGDEGFLWYGVQAVFRGEIPMRDFMAYTPPRYYWADLWFHLWRPGLIPLRFSEALFKALGLFLGLMAAKRVTSNRWELAGIGLVLVPWLFPDYKVFDGVMPLVGIYVGCRLLENPAPLTFGLSGVFVGLAFFMGLNHGAYLLASFLVLLILSLHKKVWIQEGLSFLAGLGGGLLPFLMMVLLAPGFGGIMVRTIAQILDRHNTNLALPVPWPWTLPWPGWDLNAVGAFLLGVFFLAPLVLYPCWLFLFFARKRGGGSPADLLWRVCVIVGIPYLHYAFSRADDQHLAVAMTPLMLGIFSQKVLSPTWRRVFLSLGILLTLGCAGVRSDLVQILISPPTGGNVRIGADNLRLDPETIGLLQGTEKVVKKLGPGENLLVLPHMPALYAAFGLKSPLWEIYWSFPASPEEQAREIRDIENQKVTWAIIDNCPLDGREDLRLQNTQPFVWDYLRRNFTLDAGANPNSCVSILRKTASAPGT